LDVCLQDNSKKPNTLRFNAYAAGPEGLIWMDLQSMALSEGDEVGYGAHQHCSSVVFRCPVFLV